MAGTIRELKQYGASKGNERRKRKMYLKKLVVHLQSYLQIALAKQEEKKVKQTKSCKRFHKRI